MQTVGFNEALRELTCNDILVITFSAWIIAQLIKVMIGVVVQKRFDFRWFIGTGGMPSSHAAGATALATSCGLKLGFESPLFALAAVFAIVTMFDAQGVRRATGEQASILNRIMDDVWKGGEVMPDRLLELIGHTPVQVVAGSVIGFLIALSMYPLVNG